MVNSSIEEKEWVTVMSNILNKGVLIDIKSQVLIFQVPELIKDTKPEAYTPHVVGLGPYHHFRAQTYNMQKCKLSIALRARELLKLQGFQEMKNLIDDKLHDIRLNYNGNLDLEDETLGWMMVIDGLFLLTVMYKPEVYYPLGATDELVGQVQVVPISDNNLIQEVEEGDRPENSSGEQHPWDANSEEAVLLQSTVPDEVQPGSSPKNDLVQEINQQDEEINQFEDSKGGKHSLEEILQDVVLLENQIPKIVLETLLGAGNEDSKVQQVLSYDLTELCSVLSPIELQGKIAPRIQDPHHLLDFLHQLVWVGKEAIIPKMKMEAFKFNLITDNEVQTWTSLYSHLSKLNLGFVSVILAVVDKVLKVLDALGISIPRDFFSEKQILIPSASELTRVGVKFCRVEEEGGCIRNIAFKQETESITLSLPILNTNINSNLSEVVMRNILAYEAQAMPETPKFTRYIEIMSGLMQSSADVNLLKKSGNFRIVPQDADSEEVVQLFGGLKEAIGSKGKCELDDTIEKVNAFYNSNRKVKIRKLVKRYLFISWKVLTGIAMVLVLLLVFLQTFCSVFGCANIYKSQYLAHLGL